jgi:hypothetical protein
MQSFTPGEEILHRLTTIPCTVVRVVADVVTVEMWDPDGSGKRIQKDYPADQLESYAERNAGLERPPLKPLYDV